MPRKLPWEKDGAVNVSRPKRPKSNGTPAQKRQKIIDEKDEGTVSPRMNENGRGAPSSSPPPEPATEEFMDEGLEYDDKYRMVEDEFLTIAKQFTRHLHAAEYKRQQREVKSRNADTINSISRPVTGKMPDHTKRRLEAFARAKNQKAAIEGMLGKKAEGYSDDSDDGDGLPYFGTTLHGLMDSPRKKAASLARLGTIAATTRAAAGFKQSAAQSRPDRKGVQESPLSKVAFRSAAQPKDDPLTESSDDDDDLDAPIPAPKLTAIDREPVTSSHSSVKSSTRITQSTKSFPERKQSSLSETSRSFSAIKPKPLDVEISPEIRSRSSRLERARRQKAKLEKEKQEKKKLDVIPTFL